MFGSLTFTSLLLAGLLSPLGEAAPLDKRATIPSTDTIKHSYMKQMSPKEDSCYFYVGPFKQNAIDFAKKHGRTTLYDVYKGDTEFAAPFNLNTSPAKDYLNSGQLRDWFRITSRAYAQVCSGKAYFVWDRVFPLSNEIEGWTSIWLTDELDAIQKHETRITSVTVVHPETEAESPYFIYDPAKRDALPETQEPAAWNSTVRLAKRDSGIAQDIEGSSFSHGQTVPWVPGRCSFHITQHKKPSKGDNYRFDLELYDNVQTNQVGQLDLQAIPDGQTFSMTSRLPWTLEITAGSSDNDVVKFAYAGFNFDSSSSVCKMGGYDKNYRQGDCSFACT